MYITFLRPQLCSIIATHRTFGSSGKTQKASRALAIAISTVPRILPVSRGYQPYALRACFFFHFDVLALFSRGRGLPSNATSTMANFDHTGFSPCSPIGDESQVSATASTPALKGLYAVPEEQSGSMAETSGEALPVREARSESSSPSMASTRHYPFVGRFPRNAIKLILNSF